MDPGKHALEAPHRPAVVMAGTGRILTYRELDERSDDLAAALHAFGLRTCDTIGLITDNRAEAFEIHWAAQRSDLHVTLIDVNLGVSDAARILSGNGAKAVFVSATAASLAASLRSRMADVEHWYGFGGHIDGYRAYDDVLTSAGERLTRRRRGVELPPEAATSDDAFVTLLERDLGIGPDDVYLSPVPIHHAVTLRWCAAVMALGGTVVLMERFDADDALAAIERFRVTVTQLAPTMFERMLRLPAAARTAYDVSSLRLAVHGGAPCPSEIRDRMIRWWGPLLVEYHGAAGHHDMSSSPMGDEDAVIDDYTKGERHVWPLIQAVRRHRCRIRDW